jgi:hypothetical protein
VWLDARNTTDQPLALAPDLRFALLTANGREVPDFGTSHPDAAKLIALTIDRAGLTTPVLPGAVTHALLIFDLPTTAIPQQFVIHKDSEAARFALADSIQQQKIVPETPRPTVAPPTTVPKPPTPKPEAAQCPAPSGARYGAVCKDRSRSSATGRGACSHHGGVAYWLTCP